MENFVVKRGTQSVGMYILPYKVGLLCISGQMMIACCNDGTRPVIFKIERIDIPETDAEKEWLEKQNFANTASDAYTG